MTKERTDQNALDQERGDFAHGSVRRHIVRIAAPMALAQLVQILYSVVDRIYIGHIPGASSTALTGLGLSLPLVTIILACANLYGTGGVSLCSIARGKGDEERAERIMGNSFFMILVTSVLIMALCYVVMEPLLRLFGASNESLPYARDYLMWYLVGTPFVMISTGMVGFINAQGFVKFGMATILLGAVTNIVLDPIFIFAMGWGIVGAAVASVIAQLLSAAWAFRFLTGKRALLRLTRASMRPSSSIVKSIMSLGLSGFVFQATNGIVQAVCTATLRTFGGDLFIGIMTVLTSVREVVILPMMSLANAAQPVIGFNYGAGLAPRIKSSIAFITVTNVIYGIVAWGLLFVFPSQVMGLFNSDPELLANGVPALHLYFLGFFMMAFHSAGQSTFIGLGLARHATFFSLLRKVIVVVPLTLILPHVGGLGATGVFLAEPISNFVSGISCFTVMLFALRRVLATCGKPAEGEDQKQAQ